MTNLLSQALALPTPLIEIILSYYQSPRGVSYRCDSLVFADNGPDIQCTEQAFAALMSDGSVTTWGNPAYGGDSSSVQERLKSVKVKALCATWWGAFAAIVGDDNRLMAWGNKEFGGEFGATAIKGVIALCGSYGAFAALKQDGTAFTWGHKDLGAYGNEERLRGVVDGTVEAWGNPKTGGVIPPSVKERLKQVHCIVGSEAMFAALLSDGTVETWGCESSLDRMTIKLTQVTLICASRYAFAALRKDGTVVIWCHAGAVAWSGCLAQQVEVIGATPSSFAFVRSDGRIMTWGEGQSEAPSLRSSPPLKDVAAIRGSHNNRDFAVLRKDGTVVAWKDKGSDDGSFRWVARRELKGVVALIASARAFAARGADGEVVAWGDEEYGGNKNLRKSVRAVLSGLFAGAKK